MIPIEPWSGPSHTADEQQAAVQALRAMPPEQYYQCFDWDLQDIDGLEHGLFTKVCMVAGIGNVPVLEDLIRRGADLTKKSQGDFTALHAAVQAKQLGAVNCLLGTAIGRQLATSACYGGVTPLMLACDSSIPLAIAKVLVPLSDLAATDDQDRRARDRAQEAGRGDIVTFLDMAPRSHAAPSSSSHMPPPLPDILAVVDTFQEVSRDIQYWRDRIELSDLPEMNRCWRNLLTAHRQTNTDPFQNYRSTLESVHEMKALRIRILQRAPLAPVTWLTGNEDQRVQSDQVMARIREAQDKFLRAAEDLEAVHQASAVDDLHPFPLSVSLVPVQLIIVAAQRQLERGLSTPQEAAASLARAISEGDAIVAQRRASDPASAAGHATPPTLQELRAQFESLQQQIEGSPDARSPMFDAEPAVAMLKVIAALESKQQLSETRLQGYCRQLQGHFFELAEAFQHFKRT